LRNDNERGEARLSRKRDREGEKAMGTNMAGGLGWPGMAMKGRDGELQMTINQR
jgi:hypothetical protein